MKIAAIVCSLLFVPGVVSASHELWYDRPATDSLEGWERESLPIGNGWFGINLFGGVAQERLQVTENSVLTRNNLTDALELRLMFPGHTFDACRNYRRSLELETGLARVSYELDGTTFTREAFASYPDRVMAVHLTTSKAGALAFDVTAEVPFQHPFGPANAPAANGRQGEVMSLAPRTNETGVIVVEQHLQWHDVRFAGVVAVTTDGVMAKQGEGLSIRNATEATLVFSCGTNYELGPQAFETLTAENGVPMLTPQGRKGPAPSKEVSHRVAVAKSKGWAALRKAHLADFSGLMNRVAVSLGAPRMPTDQPTDRQLSAYGKGAENRELEETYFQYGRYLLISSSRPGTLPANLQGVWTGHDQSPWGSGYWHNINVQMNYWPAFTCNLAECFEPYAAFNAAFRPVTRCLVDEYLQKHDLGPIPAAGEAPDIWCVGTAVYPYGVCGGPGGHSGPGTGGLTAKLFADWWEFTRDERALRETIWPTVHGMVDFFQRCVKDFDGKRLSAFSASPEQMVKGAEDTWWANPANRGKTPPYVTTVGCAFDQMMIWETSRDLLQLAEVLGTNDAVVATARRDLDRYDPVQIGESGQIKEFREEKKYGDIGQYHHRHISQLVGLHPGTLINKNHPDWMAAARVSLTERGDDSTGWALAHRLNCWARLGDGDHCHLLIRKLLGTKTYTNLWDAHPPFQIDGNFGATAGIAEMLLQSQAGYVDLLPALPKVWAEEGSFTGLCARNRVEVDCAWKDGRPVKVVIRAPAGMNPEVRFAGEPVTCCERIVK